MSQIMLFGPTTVSAAGGRLRGHEFGGRRPRQLLALLALEPGRTRGRDELAELLWEGDPPHGYVTTFHGYVSVLRRCLASVGATDPILTVPGGYLLEPEQVTVDLAQGYASLATADPHQILAAVELTTGGLLVEDPYTTWAQQARTAWDDAVAQAATGAARAATNAGELGTALLLARAAVARAPYCEVALRELMRAWAGSGQVSRALEAYHELRQRLRNDLGVRPQELTERAYLDLLRSGPTTAEVPVLLRLLRAALTEEGVIDAADRATGSDLGHYLVQQCG